MYLAQSQISPLKKLIGLAILGLLSLLARLIWALSYRESTFSAFPAGSPTGSNTFRAVSKNCTYNYVQNNCVYQISCLELTDTILLPGMLPQSIIQDTVSLLIVQPKLIPLYQKFNWIIPLSTLCILVICEQVSSFFPNLWLSIALQQNTLPTIEQQVLDKK